MGHPIVIVKPSKIKYSIFYSPEGKGWVARSSEFRNLLHVPKRTPQAALVALMALVWPARRAWRIKTWNPKKTIADNARALEMNYRTAAQLRHRYKLKIKSIVDQPGYCPNPYGCKGRPR